MEFYWRNNMKNAWKWILGIILGLSIVALTVLPFFMRLGIRMMPNVQRFGERGFRGFHMDGPFGMMGGGYMGGGMWGGLMAIRMVVLPLLVIALLVLISYWIGNARRQKISAQVPAQPVIQEPLPVVASVEAEKHCKSCGKHLETEWMTCPFCGTKVE
jgi:hypothetical protein